MNNVVVGGTQSIDKLREEQAGFCRGREIFTLGNIIEQYSEWQRQLYINFAALWNTTMHCFYHPVYVCQISPVVSGRVEVKT